MGSNGDLMGTQRLKKVPMGTRVPKWGPIWEQCLPGPDKLAEIARDVYAANYRIRFCESTFQQQTKLVGMSENVCMLNCCSAASNLRVLDHVHDTTPQPEKLFFIYSYWKCCCEPNHAYAKLSLWYCGQVRTDFPRKMGHSGLFSH